MAQEESHAQGSTAEESSHAEAAESARHAAESISADAGNDEGSFTTAELTAEVAAAEVAVSEEAAFAEEAAFSAEAAIAEQAEASEEAAFGSEEQAFAAAASEENAFGSEENAFGEEGAFGGEEQAFGGEEQAFGGEEQAFAAEATAEPSAEFSAEPQAMFAEAPQAEASAEFAAEPAAEASAEFAAEPSAEYSAEASAEFAAEANAEFAAEANAELTAEANAELAAEATAELFASAEVAEASAEQAETAEAAEAAEAELAEAETAEPATAEAATAEPASALPSPPRRLKRASPTRAAIPAVSSPLGPAAGAGLVVSHPDGNQSLDVRLSIHSTDIDLSSKEGNPMPRNARVSFAVTLFVSLVLIAVACNQEKSNNETSTAAAKPQAVLGARALATPAVTVTLPPPGQPPVFPADTPVPAPTASLTQAATFAWQEFIAATWPAQLAGTTFNRDVPDPNGIYGATAGTPTGAPLVWETFRHKVEIFPGTTGTNYTQQAPPHGLNLNSPDLGYNDPPQYNYAPGQVTGACNPNDPNNATTAWVNADENSQIFLDYMYAGVLGPTSSQPSTSQAILFLAKGNHVQYQYLVNPANFQPGDMNLYDGIWNHNGDLTVADQQSSPLYISAVNNFKTYQTGVLSKTQPPPTLQAPYVSFPPAWRARSSC